MKFNLEIFICLFICYKLKKIYKIYKIFINFSNKSNKNFHKIHIYQFELHKMKCTAFYLVFTIYSIQQKIDEYFDFFANILENFQFLTDI